VESLETETEATVGGAVAPGVFRVARIGFEIIRFDETYMPRRVGVALGPAQQLTISDAPVAGLRGAEDHDDAQRHHT